MELQHKKRKLIKSVSCIGMSEFVRARARLLMLFFARIQQQYVRHMHANVRHIPKSKIQLNTRRNWNATAKRWHSLSQFETVNDNMDKKNCKMKTKHVLQQTKLSFLNLARSSWIPRLWDCSCQCWPVSFVELNAFMSLLSGIFFRPSVCVCVNQTAIQRHYLTNALTFVEYGGYVISMAL